MSTTRFDLHFEQSPVALACVNADGLITRANAALGVRAGRPTATLIGTRVEALFSPPSGEGEQFDAGRAVLRSLKRAQRMGRYELLVLPATESHGVVRPRVGLLPIHDESMAVIEVLLSIDADVASNATAVEGVSALGFAEVSYALSQYELLLQEGLASFWQTDDAGQAMEWPGTIGRRARSVLHPDDALAFRNAFLSAVSSGTPFDFTARAVQPSGGYRWEHSRAVPLRAPSGEITRWLGCSFNIDELMLTQRQLTEQVRSLERRTGELELFASLLAKELKTPAAELAQAASLLRATGRPGSSGRTQDQLALIQDRAERLQSLIDTVVTWVRTVAPTDVRRVQPEKIIEEVLRILQPGSRTRIDLVTPMPQLEVSASAFHQVMSGLIGSAMRGGAKNVMVRASERDTFVDFEVDDDGPGVSDDQLPGVWRLFNETDGTRPGQVMGLSLIRQITERCGGSLELESQSGKGSTFHVLLPHKRAP